MNFYDKKTASDIREKAELELKEWIVSMINEIRTHNYIDQFDNNLIENYVNSEYQQKLPAIVNVLLNKSGLIFPEKDGINSVLLNYDDVDKWDDENAGLYIQSVGHGGLNGGLHKGHIHT